MKLDEESRKRIFQSIPWTLIFTTVLTCLKVFGKIDIPWGWVFAPVWATAIFSVGVIALAGLLVLVLKMREERDKKNG